MREQQGEARVRDEEFERGYRLAIKFRNVKLREQIAWCEERSEAELQRRDSLTDRHKRMNAETNASCYRSAADRFRLLLEGGS